MNKRPALRASIAAIIFIGATGAGLSQTSPQPAAPSPPPITAPVPYVMTMGDMMNTLVQPRYAKLALAGEAENWSLAGYGIVEIRQAFAGIVKAQPKFHGLPVAELVEAALSQPMTAVETAIKQQDSERFTAAFNQLTQGCNACHAATDHAFVVMKTPDASAFPSQDFSARR